MNGNQGKPVEVVYPTEGARLIIGDGRSREIGRFTTIAASLIVIATAGALLLGALERFIR